MATKTRTAAVPAATKAAPKAGKKASQARPADAPPPAPAQQASTRAEKADKARKPKLVRDSFTIPKIEYAVLEEMKLRAAKLGRPTKKSEVLRAGVQALAAMGDAAFLACVGAVPAVKTGRPAKT
jgi:hypothetical protein